jgi:hypothetical protein
LLPFVNTRTYFERVKIEGKTFRESLNTDIYTTAKLPLDDFIKKKMKRAARLVAGTFLISLDRHLVSQNSLAAALDTIIVIEAAMPIHLVAQPGAEGLSENSPALECWETGLGKP